MFNYCKIISYCLLIFVLFISMNSIFAWDNSTGDSIAVNSFLFDDVQNKIEGWCAEYKFR